MNYRFSVLVLCKPESFFLHVLFRRCKTIQFYCKRLWTLRSMTRNVRKGVISYSDQSQSYIQRNVKYRVTIQNEACFVYNSTIGIFIVRKWGVLFSTYVLYVKYCLVNIQCSFHCPSRIIIEIVLLLIVYVTTKVKLRMGRGYRECLLSIFCGLFNDCQYLDYI